MLVKLLASGVILLGSAYLGMFFAFRYKKRVMQLTELENAITQLEFDIDYMNLALCDSFEKIVKNTNDGVREIFLYVYERLKRNPCSDMQALWRRAMERCSAELCLTEEDKQIILDFSRTLGSGNREKEMNNIKVTLMRLKIAQDEARCDAGRNVKMYRGLGVLIGVFMIIVLL